MALLVTLGLLSGCAGDRASPVELPPPAVSVRPLPAVSVPLRWSLSAASCAPTAELRAIGPRCASGERDLAAVLVADRPEVVLRLVEASAVRWERTVALAGVPHTATVVLVPQSGPAVLAVATADAVEVVLLDAATGAEWARAELPIAGAAALQLERRHDGDLLRVHARTSAGAVSALVDLGTGAALGLAPVPARAIVERRAAAQPAALEVEATDGADHFAAAWDGDELVVRTAGWRTVLAGSRFRDEEVTLHAHGAQVVGTVHHPRASSTQVFAIDRATGAVRWRHGVTGIGPTEHSAYDNQVASRLDGDYLVVQGVESAGAYACVIDLLTGLELACVDGLAPGDPAR